MQARDVNGDGKTDLVMMNGGIAVSTGDFDGDGRIDICVSYVNSSILCRYRR